MPLWLAWEEAAGVGGGGAGGRQVGAAMAS